MNEPWTQQYRDLLDEILDQLIPANLEKNIPAAGSFGVGDFIASRAADDEVVSTAVNDLLFSAVSMDGCVNPEMVRQLEAHNAEKFAVLINLTYMGYYSRPEIRSLVGVGSWPVHPKGYEVPAESADMLKKLTAPVTQRGPVYRKPNDEQQAGSQ